MMSTRFISILTLALLTLMGVLYARDAGPERDGIYIGKRIQYLVETKGALTPIQAMRSPHFQASTEQHPNFGFQSGAVWLQFALRANKAGEYVLDIGREWIDSARLYSTAGGVPRLLHRSGTERRVRDRPIHTVRIAFPIALKAAPTHFLLRLQSRSPLSLHGVLRSANNYARINAQEHLLFGGYVGLMLGLAAYSLLLFFLLREQPQLYVALLLLSYAGAEAMSHGYLSWLFGTKGGWLELGGGALFFASFTALLFHIACVVGGFKERWILGLRIAVPIPALIACVYPRWYFLVFFTLAVCVTAVLTIMAFAAHKGKRRAGILLVAVSCLLVPGSISIGVQWGLLPAYQIVEFGNHVGAVVMSILFSLLLADDIRDDRSAIQGLNVTLEERVGQLNDTKDALQGANDALKQDRRAIELLNTELERRLVQLEEAADTVQQANQELRYQVSARSSTLVNLLAKHEGRIQAAPPEIGDIFDSRYQIQEVLGSGGWGLVYRVERVSDQRPFALKLLTRDLSGKKAARLAREAEIGAKLHHPNIVGFVDVGINAGGAPYIVMELIHGGSLEDHADRFGDIKWILPLLRDAAHGLAALHERGIIHRDIKPGNVLLDTTSGTEVARISDFGISLQHFSTTDETLADNPNAIGQPSRLTLAGTLLGTPAYMAPELVAIDQETTPATDVFAFGILVFEGLMGSHPFSVLPLKSALAEVPLSTPKQLDTPDEVLNAMLSPLISASLYLSPKARPSIKELAQAFDKVLSQQYATQAD